ncbi:MAG: YwqG family protein [Firmicutes bacterium]|nr:YwqG family protein [Bacillota bacterium]
MKTLKDVESLLNAYGLYNQFERLKPHIRSSIHMELEPVGDECISIGFSKMGGLPDLPSGIEWFRQDMSDIPLSFVCQINFAEVKPFDTEGKLPDSGILYFFYDCSEDGMPWGYDPADSNGKIVYYYDGDLSELKRREAPEDIEENGCVFGAAQLRFETAFDLPDLDSPSGEALDMSKNDLEKYLEMLDDVSGYLNNKMLGHPNNLQGSMELECELVSSGLYCGDSSGYIEGKKKGMDKNAHRWRLLLQIESNEEIGMIWEDCGMLYLWIPEEELSAKNFDASWLILQCY